MNSLKGLPENYTEGWKWLWKNGSVMATWGGWLSGGLDSSIMTALAKPHVRRLDTFAVGLPGAPDLEYACIASGFLKCIHHEVIVCFKEMLAVLLTVIYHLESFDALLVHSRVMNFLAVKRASVMCWKCSQGRGETNCLQVMSA
jgi:asparagine synthase (glutamine-hydrolysing)